MLTAPPYLQVSEATAKNNISKMVSKAEALNLELRPHFKTHQSSEIGEWFREYGIQAITVSSLKMAEYFADHGWEDITVAFPVNILESQLINTLNSRINLKILIADPSVIGFLESTLHAPLHVYVEIDPDYGRSGVSIHNKVLVSDVVNSIKSSKKLTFEGFYSHAGHSYKCRGKDEIKRLFAPLIRELSGFKNKFGGKLCWGDTPSCSVLEEFGEADQISPGNFVFYDWTQTRIDSCSYSDIAVTMQSPVIAKFPERMEILVHGGAVHFSKDSIQNEGNTLNFGQAINPKNPEDFSNYLKSISQEHGLISCSEDFFNNTNVGDTISIYPIHSCLTANLMRAYHTEDGKIIDHFGSGAPF